MATLLQKMTPENLIKLQNADKAISSDLTESLGEKTSWLELTLKDLFYLELVFSLKLNVVDVNEFFKN
jgi:hypothetical protein